MEKYYLVITTNTTEGLQIGISLFDGGNLDEYGGTVVGNAATYEEAVELAEKIHLMEENSYICYKYKLASKRKEIII